MADYSIMADITNALLKLLREKMCPETIRVPESITAISPADKNTDYSLGVFLYNTSESGEYQQVTRIQDSKADYRFPPKTINLYYMLYINAKSQSGTNLIDEQKLLAKVFQVIYDYPRIENNSLPAAALFDEEDSFISFESLEFEAKSKIWTSLNTPYQNAVYIRVSPVFISSEKTMQVKRVTSADFSTVEK